MTCLEIRRAIKLMAEPNHLQSVDDFPFIAGFAVGALSSIFSRDLDDGILNEVRIHKEILAEALKKEAANG